MFKESFYNKLETLIKREIAETRTEELTEQLINSSNNMIFENLGLYIECIARDQAIEQANKRQKNYIFLNEFHEIEFKKV